MYFALKGDQAAPDDQRLGLLVAGQSLELILQIVQLLLDDRINFYILSILFLVRHLGLVSGRLSRVWALCAQNKH